MDKEILRQQIFEEIQGQFESRLRDVKRQKTNVEEELELASEKWRAERRRLNAEIDRLMAAAKPAAPAPASNGADDGLKKASAEWDTERARLNSQISRLERAVADAIERSSNPLRSTQPLKEQFEARLEEAEKRRVELEQQFLRAQAEWDADKKRMTGEIIRLRRFAPLDKAMAAKEKIDQLRGVKTETIEEKRIRELEARLSEAQNEIDRLHREAAAARESETVRFRSLADETLNATRKLWEQERGELIAQIQQLQRTTGDSQSRVDDDIVEQLRRQYDQKLQEMAQQKTELAQSLQSATELLAAERARFAQEAAARSNSSGPNAEVVGREVQRVEGMIQKIADLIENPSTELSTVIRKNVEKAELDAYLKGILFSLGRGESL